MDATARVTSKGQITVPKAVRDALRITEGDQLVFRSGGCTAVLSATGWETTGGGVFHDEIYIGKSHTHTKVVPGGGLSGPPPR